MIALFVVGGGGAILCLITLINLFINQKTVEFMVSQRSRHDLLIHYWMYREYRLFIFINNNKYYVYAEPRSTYSIYLRCVLRYQLSRTKCHAIMHGLLLDFQKRRNNTAKRNGHAAKPHSYNRTPIVLAVHRHNTNDTKCGEEKCQRSKNPQSTREMERRRERERWINKRILHLNTNSRKL